ncbi:MAG TPA: hypothetical protein VHQ01_02295, partial [Pyrinomonadaceae bacterium]|nr:hypothetical protein [Pyrinomonadaceae bacterium]
MGVPTPEKILGVPETNADQTAAERFYARQQQAEAERPTNFLTAPQWNLSGEAQMNSGQNVSGAVPKANQPMFSPAFGQPVQTASAPVQSASVWPNPFGVAPAEQKQTQEQLADAEQFQKLLSPHLTPEATAPVNF